MVLDTKEVSGARMMGKRQIGPGNKKREVTDLNAESNVASFVRVRMLRW